MNEGEEEEGKRERDSKKLKVEKESVKASASIVALEDKESSQSTIFLTNSNV